MLRIVRDKRFGLYRGWGWTAARNAPGLFAIGLISSQMVSMLTTGIALWWICVYQGILL